MRIPLIAGNWKMNTTADEAMSLVTTMLPELKKTRDVEILLCPPFISLWSISDILNNTGISLGAQNMHFEEKGAFTGEISPLMLAGICRYVILGHSERRHIFGETDNVINKKVLSALSHDLVPIMCVGETLHENESGKTEEIISRQVHLGLKDIGPQSDIVIAYEPVWAIGTGKAATVKQAETTSALIRSLISGIWGTVPASQIRILYGGSVTPANIAELASQPDIDGALVGGASLKVGDFSDIVRQTAEIYSG